MSLLFVTTFAEAAHSAEPTLFEALGIDWRLLIIQIAAFLVMVWALGKFVYPWLMKSVDQRQAQIEAAAKASKRAQEMANQTQAQTVQLLDQARKEAGAIVSTARQEAAEIVSDSEARAKLTAEQIAKAAQEDVQRQIQTAKKQMHNEMVSLIALATAKVVGASHTAGADEKLIVKSLKEVEK